MLSLIKSVRKHIRGPRGHHLLNAIDCSSKILQYLVNDMLDLYLIKKGKFKKYEQAQDVAKEL